MTEIRDKVLYLKERGREMIRLEEMKQLAIEHEDYDVAKALKIKIENDKRILKNQYGIEKLGNTFHRSSRSHK